MKEDYDVNGDLEPIGDRLRLRFVRQLPHPPEKVGRSLRESEHLAEWFPDRILGELTAGAQLRFVDAAGGNDQSFEGEVLACEAPGWHVGLDSLEHHLADTATTGTTAQRWSDVHRGHVEKFGASAATIGPPPASQAPPTGEGLR